MTHFRKTIVFLLIGIAALSISLTHAQSEYMVTLWPVSGGGASSGGGYTVIDVSGKVGMGATPSSGGQYTVDDGIVAPVQPIATPTTPVITPTPPTATPTTSVVTPTPPTATPITPVATPTSPKVYLPVVVK